jgi:hypothetical protein
MNNLTPLQEIASRIYAAKISSSYYTEPCEYSLKGGITTMQDYNSKKLLKESITEARQLLEATKPEPLEWYKQAEALHQSGVENFTISEYDTDINGGKLTNIEYQLREDGKLIGYFFDLDIAKQFAEFIRTR